MNRFSVIGRLTADPELRYTKEQKEIANYTLAVKTGAEDTAFIKITSFNKVAKTISEYIHKGDLILVEGAIKNNNYVDKDGKKHFEYVFIGNTAQFLNTTGKHTEKKESAKKVPENGLSDEAFEEFGKKIEIEDNELAF